MFTINSKPPPLLPVQVDFSWNNRGPEPLYSIGAATYPYHHQADEVVRASDFRYADVSTFINVAVTFDALDSKAESLPKTTVPPGVHITEYLWDFGDGFLAFGSLSSHIYIVADPNTAVTLIVTDSRGLRWSCRKLLGLIFGGAGGIISSYKVRG